MKRSDLAVGLTLDEEGRAIYENTMHKVPTRIRFREGLAYPYYLIKGHFIRCELLDRALASGDLSVLDAPLPRAPRSRAARPPTARALEMLELSKQGNTYQEIGDRFSVSRQRAHAILKRLATN